MKRSAGWVQIVVIIFLLIVAPVSQTAARAANAEPEKAQIRFGGVIKSSDYYSLEIADLYLWDYSDCDGVAPSDWARTAITVGEPAPLSFYTYGCGTSSLNISSCNRLFIKPQPSYYVEWNSRTKYKPKAGFGGPVAGFYSSILPDNKRYTKANWSGSTVASGQTESYSGTYEVDSNNNVVSYAQKTYSDSSGSYGPYNVSVTPHALCSGPACDNHTFPIYAPQVDELKKATWNGYDSGSLTITYTDEYTTAQLKTDTLAALPAYDSYWSGTPGSFSDLSVDELWYNIRESRYRIRYTPTGIVGAPSLLKWVERFVPEAGVPINSVEVADGGYGYTSAPTVTISAPGGTGTTAQATATVAGGMVTAVNLTNAGSGYKQGSYYIYLSGGGGSGAVVLLHYGTETEKSATISAEPPPGYDPNDYSTRPIIPASGYYDLPVPSSDGITTVDNVHIPASQWKRLDQSIPYQIEASDGNWLLMAMPARTSGSGECEATLGSVNFKVDLGPSPDGYAYGKIQLYTDTINSTSALRAQWTLITTAISVGQVERITDSGGLRQITSPAGIIDLLDVSGGCDIRFYTSSDYEPLNNGLHPIKSNAVPYATYEIRDATAASVAKLLIKELRPSATGKYHLYGQQTGDIWSLEQGTLGSGSTLVPDSRTTRTPVTILSQPAYSFTEEDYTYSPGPRTTTRRTFTKDAAAPYTSRDQSIDYPEGKRVTYDYTTGYYNSYSGVFTAYEWGSDLLTTETVGRAFVSPELWAGHSTRTATVTNYEGRTLQSTLAAYNGSGFTDVEQTRYGYDYAGNLQTETQNGRVAYSCHWTDGFKDWEVDEAGVKTTYTAWPDGTYVTTSGKQPVMTKVKAAVASYDSYPAQSAITTTYYYSPDGNGDVYISAEETNGGGLTQTTAFTQDTEGRLTYTEAKGLHTTYAYTPLSGGGLRTTLTRPSGATEIREEDANGRILSVSGTGVTSEYHTYTQDIDGHDVHTTYYGSSTATTPNYLSLVTDTKGRRLRELRPSYLTATTAGVNERNFYYDTAGQLVKETATGMADRLYVYNDLGELWRSGYDMNGDGQLTLASTDKIQQTETTYQQDGSDWYRVSTVQIPYTLNSATLTTVSQTKERLTLPAGTLRDTISIDEAGVQTHTVSTVNLPQALVENSTTVSGTTGTSLRVTRNGLLQAEQTNAQTAPTLYAYDGLGRLETVTPAGGPVTVYGYNGDGLLQTTTRNSPDNTQALAESLTYHAQDNLGAGQVASRTIAGQTTYYAYDVRGQVLRQWGATYPVRFTYDALGRLETLHTYRAAGFDLSGASWPAGDVTTWTYHPATGQLTAKTDAASQPVNYSYRPSGLPYTRTWARGLITTYGYSNAGELTSISYSDTTPAVGITYDRAGRRLATTDAAGTLTRSYESGVLTNELYTGAGLLSGRTITRGLDTYGRLSSLNTDAGYTLSYTYDGPGRLDELTQGTHLAKYVYKANVGSVETVTIKRQGVDRVFHEHVEDGLGRLKTVRMTTGAVVPVERGYHYNTANQRDRITHEDTRLWSYGYDSLGQVTSAEKRLADDVTPLPGHSFAYDFDQIGNREETMVNGRTATYTPNQLNQIESRQVPGAVDVRGEALASATVTVDAQSTTRTGKDYYREVALANSTTATKARLSIAATNGTQTVTETRLAFLQQTPEVFEYDLDGNLKKDGRWDYTWDAENRLVKMETRSTVASASGIACQRLTFAYDSQGRRIRKLVELFNPTTSQWVQNSDIKFIYDGWNLLTEQRWNPTTSTYVSNVSYAWGIDLSGTPQGAGGVGGLLWANLDMQTFAASADANGNVVAYVNTDTQAVAGRLDYSAFGEPVVKTGVAGLIPYGFSSKYTDSETGLAYYGYRYYDTSIGRWLCKDPIGEAGGANLYAMVNNDPVKNSDYLGLLLGFFRDMTDSEEDSYFKALNHIRTVSSRYEMSLNAFLRANFPLTYMNPINSSRESVSKAKLNTLNRYLLEDFMLEKHNNRCNLNNALKKIVSVLSKVNTGASDPLNNLPYVFATGNLQYQFGFGGSYNSVTGAITFSPDSFKRMTELVTTTSHELSHKYAKTVDNYYYENEEKRLNDAYAYGNFYGNVYTDFK